MHARRRRSPADHPPRRGAGGDFLDTEAGPGTCGRHQARAPTFSRQRRRRATRFDRAGRSGAVRAGRGAEPLYRARWSRPRRRSASKRGLRRPLAALADLRPADRRLLRCGAGQCRGRCGARQPAARCWIDPQRHRPNGGLHEDQRLELFTIRSNPSAKARRDWAGWARPFGFPAGGRPRCRAAVRSTADALRGPPRGSPLGTRKRSIQSGHERL